MGHRYHDHVDSEYERGYDDGYSDVYYDAPIAEVRDVEDPDPYQQGYNAGREAALASRAEG